MSYLFLQLILTLPFSTPPSQETIAFNLTKLGFYQFGGFEIHAVDEHYLFSGSKPEEVLKIVSKEGEVLHVYDKRGEGPGELNFQSVVAVTEDQIIIHSRSSGLISFDHQLNLIEPIPSLKPFSREITRIFPPSFSDKENQILVFDNTNSTYNLSIFSLADRGNKEHWTPFSEQLKRKHYTRDITEQERNAYHNETFFTYQAVLKPTREYYRILAHKNFNGTWKPVTELYAKAEGMPNWMPNITGVVEDVFVRKLGGYVVYLTVGKEGSKDPYDTTSYLDYFDENGTFQRRVPHHAHNIIKVFNNGELFNLVERGDDDVLVPLTFQ